MSGLQVALIIAVLVGANAVFVAAEFALIGLRATRMQQLAGDGNAWARRLWHILRDAQAQDRYFATVQLGITIASLGLGMFGEHELAERLLPLVQRYGFGEVAAHSAAAAIALASFTYLHVVVGEMIPKSLALGFPEATARWVADPVMLLGRGLAPLVWLLNLAGDQVLRALRIPAASASERLLSSEELALVIDQSTEGGLFRPQQGQILQSIFDFAERTVYQVLTPRTKIEAFGIDTPEEELAAALATTRHTRFPVFRDNLDHVVGILHIKDFVRWRLKPARGPLDLQKLLRPARMVPELMSLEDMLTIFKSTRSHMALVLDEYGGTAGLVTLEDLIEEVVGEVHDEFDDETPPVQVLSGGVLLAEGAVQLEDLANDHGVALPEDAPDSDTVGGLVLTVLGRPAVVGDVVRLGSLRLTVLRVSGMAVELVRVEAEPEAVSPDGGSEAEVGAP